jgi:hypothetical protein
VQIDALRAEVQSIARETGQATAAAGKAKEAATQASDMVRDVKNRIEGGNTGNVTPGNDKVRLSIAGHVNRALMFADDGDQSDLFNVDNDTEPTLINIVGEYKTDIDLIIGARFEAQFASNASNGVSQNTENAAIGGVNFSERFLEV